MDKNHFDAFRAACRHVLTAARGAKPDAMIQYAAAYADAGLGMTDRAAIRTQSMYILSNLSGWRGDEARATRETLKKFAK